MKRVVVLSLVLSLAACSGPSSPVEVGGKEIPVDITLGRQVARPSVPPALDPTGIGFPGFVQPPVPVPGPGLVPPVTSPPCPRANPLDAAHRVAERRAPAPPRPATYPFSNRGTIAFGTTFSDYPPFATRRVHAVARLADRANFEFSVSVRLLGETTTTRYRVLNSGTTPDRGIYLAQIVSKTQRGSVPFTPQPPILLMPFPSPEYGTNLEDEIDEQRGDTYRTAGTDPLTRTTMTVEAAIRGKDRVDACGEWVDAYDIEIVQGTIVSPTRQIEFRGRLKLAPQYGGLSVSDHIEMEGADGGFALQSQNTTRIRRMPLEPR